MRLTITRLLTTGVVLALLAGFYPAQAMPATKASSKKVSHSSSKNRHHRARKGAWKRHGQQKIDEARTRDIQQALIREKYLDGQPNGQWDARTQAAMSRYQAENGWQSKVTPDSRAIIKLGLGPNHEGELLNFDAKPSSSPVVANSATTPNGSNGSKR